MNHVHVCEFLMSNTFHMWNQQLRVCISDLKYLSCACIVWVHDIWRDGSHVSNSHELLRTVIWHYGFPAIISVLTLSASLYYYNIINETRLCGSVSPANQRADAAFLCFQKYCRCDRVLGTCESNWQVLWHVVEQLYFGQNYMEKFLNQ